MDIILTAFERDHRAIVLVESPSSTIVAIPDLCKQVILRGNLEVGKTFGLFTIKYLYQ